MSALAASDRERLARLLGMLGSDHLGEVANAGRLADKMVRAAGLTWPDIIAPARSPPDGDADTDPIRDWRRTAAACSRYSHLLNLGKRSSLSDYRDFPACPAGNTRSW